MTLSRTSAGLLPIAFAAAPLGAQIPVDYRLPPVSDPPLRLDVRADCPPSSADDIVVCGERIDLRFRVSPSEPVPGARRRLIAGEPPSGIDAMAAGSPDRCSTIGPNPQCTRGLDILGVVFGIVRLIGQARANRD